jgi:hypothetical protein
MGEQALAADAWHVERSPSSLSIWTSIPAMAE